MPGKTTHGEGGKGHYTPEYRSWRKMRSRCSPNNDPVHVKNYLLRGITVCKRWDSYENFLLDMGRKPSPEHTIERIDNDKGYFPANCRWATLKEQAFNKRSNRVLDVDGVKKTTTEWAHIMGLRPNTIATRLWSGWSVADAVKTPADCMGVRRPRKITAAIGAEILAKHKKGWPTSKIAKFYGVNNETIRQVKVGKGRWAHLHTSEAA